MVYFVFKAFHFLKKKKIRSKSSWYDDDNMMMTLVTMTQSLARQAKMSRRREKNSFLRFDTTVFLLPPQLEGLCNLVQQRKVHLCNAMQ